MKPKLKIPKQRFRIRPTKRHTPKPKKKPKYKESFDVSYLDRPLDPFDFENFGVD